MCEQQNQFLNIQLPRMIAKWQCFFRASENYYKNQIPHMQGHLGK